MQMSRLIPAETEWRINGVVPENGKEFLENTCRMRMRGRVDSNEWVWGLV